MLANETLTNEYLLINEHSRKFPVKRYFSPTGYVRDGHTMPCRFCNLDAQYRYEIGDHLYQPIGSEYYCAACAPPPKPHDGD